MGTFLVVQGACRLTAPAAVTGLASGAACGADIQCTEGLACECGTCVPVDGGDDPPLCGDGGSIGFDGGSGGCNITPLPCFLDCESAVVIGESACIGGRDSCANVGGVLSSQCADADAGIPDAGDDAGLDAGLDAGDDAGDDAGLDAGDDAGLDAGDDAGNDAG